MHQEACESSPELPVLFPISIFIIIIIIVLQLHSYQATFSTSVQQDSKGLCGIHFKIFKIFLPKAASACTGYPSLWNCEMVLYECLLNKYLFE